MVPNDDIETKFHHAGMLSGRKIIKVEAINKEIQGNLPMGEAEVEEPVSVYVFIGRKNQEQGMGMGLYDSALVAREV